MTLDNLERQNKVFL